MLESCMKAVIETEESASDAVLRAVSEFESCPPTALPPLYEAIDTDALNALCRRRADGRHKYECRLTFEYHDSLVVIDTNESITVSVT